MSYCHQPMSVMLSTFCSNNIFSETARPRALIIDMKRYLVNRYQVYSNDSLEVQNGPEQKVLGLKIKYNFKSSSLELLGSKFGM